MKRYVIDTNALISFVTDRNPGQQQKVGPLFESAAHLKVAILCHQHVLTEFIYVMDKVYDVPKQDINMMVRDLMAMPGVEVIHTVDFNIVFTYWPKLIEDFGDAIVASVCKTHKGSVIMTFDLKFINTLKKLGLDVYRF